MYKYTHLALIGEGMEDVEGEFCALPALLVSENEIDPQVHVPRHATAFQGPTICCNKLRRRPSRPWR